jgi:hypothetical protein
MGMVGLEVTRGRFLLGPFTPVEDKGMFSKVAVAMDRKMVSHASLASTQSKQKNNRMHLRQKQQVLTCTLIRTSDHQVNGLITFSSQDKLELADQPKTCITCYG